MSQKLFVGGLSWNTGGIELQKEFEAYGVVLESTVVADRETGRSRGFGFVTMEDDAAAKTAVEKLNGAMVDGRAIRVDLAQSRGEGGDRGGGNRGGGGGGGGYGRGGGYGGGGGGGGRY